MTLSWQHLLAFLVAVCVLVTVHEYGHFWVARKLGFKVLRFSVGFGKPLWRRVAGPDQTEYILAAVPLGGYVKMLDEREGPVAAAELDRAFTRRPHWQRIAVLLAGPAANFIFAILLLTGMIWTTGVTQTRPVMGAVSPASLLGRSGLRDGDEIVAINGKATPDTEDVLLGLVERISGSEPISLSVRAESGGERELRVVFSDPGERKRLSEPTAMINGLGLRFKQVPIPAVLGEVRPKGPAAVAGLQTGDAILAVNGESVRDFEQLAGLIRTRPGESVDIRYRRGNNEHNTRVAVASEMQEGKPIGRMQIGAAEPPLDGKLRRHVSPGPFKSLQLATERAWSLTALQARMMWRMVAGQVSVKNISGPLSIAQMAGESAIAGVSAFFGFLVLISLALGFMNLLPIPILDGGQVVLQTIEWIKGSPLSERAQLAGQQVGIMMVVLLMGLALYNDIARQFF
jgi:regulator of sigma E protease